MENRKNPIVSYIDTSPARHYPRNIRLWHIVLWLAVIVGALWCAAANAEPVKGKVIPRAELPAAIQTTKSKKTSKFPGIPACAKGRLEITDHDSEPMLTWRGANQEHRCFDAPVVYVCAAFGKLSVKCE